MDLNSLAMRIRIQREKRGLKQNDLASALQITPQAVSKWERGENAPDIAQLAPLSRLLGVSIDWLLGCYSKDLDVFEASVFASGVRTARRKSEEMTPRDFASWINAYCFQATEAVVRHGGIPIKYMGPGILCFFSGAGHGERAIRAALETSRAADEPLKIGIGAGEVFLGSIGHPDYARPDVIGEAVSVGLLAMDWAPKHTRSGIAVQKRALESATEEYLQELLRCPAKPVRLPGIRHAVPLVEIVA